MKKLFTILLVILYGIFTAGVNVMIHTCGGESEALIATTSFEDPCGCSDELPGDRCCTTEITTVQLDEAQQSVLSISLDPLQVTAVRSLCECGSDLMPSITVADGRIDTDSSPPDLDLNILHSVFLI